MAEHRKLEIASSAQLVSIPVDDDNLEARAHLSKLCFSFLAASCSCSDNASGSQSQMLRVACFICMRRYSQIRAAVRQ